MRKSIEAAEAAERQARDVLHAKREEIAERIRREWREVGGCVKCGGTGRLRACDGSGDSWDVGPCLGYVVGEKIYGGAVYSDTEKNEHGYPLLVAYEPYDQIPRDALTPFRTDPHQVKEIVDMWTVNRDIPCTAATHGKCPTLAHATAADLRDLDDLEESYKLAQELTRGTVRDETPHKGATVIVKRGRKVPLGTTGVIMWLGEERFGGVATRRGGFLGGKVSTRLGLKVDGHDKLVYVNADNCDVVKPAIDVVLPSLWGSEKQTAWAERIRRDAMTAGTATDADLQNGTARFWIDNRERFAKGAA